MPFDDDFVASWQHIEPKEVVEAVQSAANHRFGTRWIIRNEVTPVDLVAYLVARFGPPNGIQNFLRSNDSDNLIHWDWLLRTKDGLINFLGMSFRTEVFLRSDTLQSPEDRDALIAQLKADFGNHGPRMAQARKSFEHWVEFVNPYRRLELAIERLLTELREMELDPAADAIPDMDALGDAAAVKDAWEEMAARYSRAVGLCFGVRTMLPVLGEAFINMVLYLLMRPEIRKDDRLREHTFRQPIDIRIKSLPLNTHGFEKNVDYSVEACRKYHSLVNERNDLLHGNVVIDKLKFGEVFFVGTVPIFKEYRTMWHRSMGVSLKAVGLDRVEEEYAAVHELRSYVLSCLAQDVRENLEFMLDRRDLGLESSTGRIGVLFADWMVDFLPTEGPAQASSEESGGDATSSGTFNK